jgi:membrane protein implicated in regulation of membrane protease activity
MAGQWLPMLADTGSWFWWVGAGVLLVVELMTGTFYLLMIALGFVVAGLSRLSGAAPGGQIWIAALAAAVAIVAVRVIKRRYRLRRALAAERDIGASDQTASGARTGPLGAGRPNAADLDVGESVYVAHWEQRRARAQYRGADWDVALEAGVPEAPGWFRIRRIEGIKLILAS